MTLAFKELAGSPVETYGPEGMKAERRTLVAWENRHAMVTELLGDGYEFGGRAPAQYPGRPKVVAMDVRIEPWPECPDGQSAFDDITSDLNSYSGKYAQIVIKYELLDESGSRDDLPEIEDDTFLTYRMEFAGEYDQPSGQSFQWELGPVSGDAPVQPDDVPTVRVPVVEHHVTWHRVVRPPWQAIRDCIGMVNSAAFLGAAAETVLFDGARADKQFLRVDELEQPEFGWKIAYVFREKAVKYDGGIFGQITAGWNHRYRALPTDEPNWDRLVDANNQSLYRSSDFTPLFLFAALA